MNIIRKGPFQLLEKPTDVTCKLIHPNNKKIQHRNNPSPYYPKQYALCELTHLYSSTG